MLSDEVRTEAGPVFVPRYRDRVFLIAEFLNFLLRGCVSCDVLRCVLDAEAVHVSQRCSASNVAWRHVHGDGFLCSDVHWSGSFQVGARSLYKQTRGFLELLDRLIIEEWSIKVKALYTVNC